MLPRASDFYQRQEFHFDFGGGQSLTFTNLRKVFYPKTGFTKADILEYYLDIADYLLPHLRERPLTLKRYPDGVEGEFFYEKRCPEYRPDWLKTAAVTAGKERERQISYCIVSDLASLLWVVNIGDLELHTTLYTTRSEGNPTSMVFDLDPGEPANIISCADVALLLKGLFDDLQLACGVKSSGGKGLQVYVPLDPRRSSFEETKNFARSTALVFEKRYPKLITASMTKEKRKGKVLIDWSQNDPHKTTVSVYSLRGQHVPTVSTPLDWRELEIAAAKSKPELLSFSPAAVRVRVRTHGDLFQVVLDEKQELPYF